MTYDYDLCVLFLYHRCDELTNFHLASLRKSNPTAMVLPLTDSVPELLPGSIDVSRLPPFCDDAQKWRGIDATVYRWFENRTFNARRYLVAEYDCFCNVSLSDYYARVWHAEVVGIDFFTRQSNPHWKWFINGEVDNIPPEDRLYAAGIVPFTCTMFSHAALQNIVGNVYRRDIFSEMRLGTIVNKLGLKFQQLPLPERSTICWHEYPCQTNRPGLFHAVKRLDHNQGKSQQPKRIGARVYDFVRASNCDRELLPFYLRGKCHGIKKRLPWSKSRQPEVSVIKQR